MWSGFHGLRQSPQCALWPVGPVANSAMLSPPRVDRAGLPRKSRQRAAVVVRHEVAEDPGAAGRDVPGAVEHVLVRDRHSVQRPRRFAPGERGIGRRRVFERALGLERDEAVEHGLQSLRTRDGSLHDLHRGELPGGQRVRERSEAHRVDFDAHVDVRRVPAGRGRKLMPPAPNADYRYRVDDVSIRAGKRRAQREGSAMGHVFAQIELSNPRRQEQDASSPLPRWPIPERSCCAFPRRSPAGSIWRRSR